MRRPIFVVSVVILIMLGSFEYAVADVMHFDQARWATGDMNEQAPADSSGAIGNSHLDHFYYRERIPMCMTVIDDSLGEGSSGRTYDSAVLAIVVAASGLAETDSLRLFGQRLTRPWSENGVSWNFHHASTDSAWNSSGGDINTLNCTDTVVVDTAVDIDDTLYFHLDTGFVRHMVETDNFGWLMMAENIVDRATFQVYTEDTGEPSRRPVLTVYYSEEAPGVVMPGRRRRLAGN